MEQIFQDAQSAYGWVVAQTQNIETEIYNRKYPDANYSEVVPVVTEGNPWAAGTTFYMQDIVGKTEWLGNDANDLPYVELLRDTGSRPYYARGNGYKWNLMEVNRAAMLPNGGRLTADKADGARSVAERSLFNIAIAGDTEKGWDGLINYTGITAADVAANGTGNVTWWALKTADQIIADITINFNAIGIATKWIEIPDRLAVPPEVLMDLATRRISSGGDGGMTILDYINQTFSRAYNVNFRIVPLRQLTTADPGGDGRAVLYKFARDVVRFHLPRPYMFEPIFQKDTFTWEQLGFYITGGTEIRLPKAVIYMDGVFDAP
jgi:hypothetical protein